MEEDDDDCFGEFEFASSFPQLNPTVHSLLQINAPNSSTNTDDDEWGDFITRKSNKLSSDPLPSRPNSTPGKVNTNNNCSKAGGGAIPLSIFGEDEKEEEGSGVVGAFGNNGAPPQLLQFDKRSNSDVSSRVMGFNDIIASLYCQSINNEDKKVENSKENGSNLGSNVLNSKRNGFNLDSDESNLREKGSDLVSGGLNLKENGSNSSTNGLNFDSEVFSVNNGMKMLNQNEQTKIENRLNFDLNLFSTLESDRVDSGRKMLNKSEEVKRENGSNLELCGLDYYWSVSNTLGSDGVDLGRKVVSQSEQIKIENGTSSKLYGKEKPTSGLVGLDFSSNGSIFGSDGLYSCMNMINQSGQIMNGSRSNTNLYDMDFGSNQMEGAKGLDLNKKSLNLNSTEEEDEDDNGWEFQDARNEHVDSNIEEGWGSGLLVFGAETAARKQEIEVGEEGKEYYKGAESASMSDSGGHDHSDWFSHSKSSDLCTGFDFLPSIEFQNGYVPEVSKSMQKETGSEFKSLPVDGSDDSDENMWEFKEAPSEITEKNMEKASVVNLSFPEVDISTNGCEIQVNEIKPEDPNGALPLSLFSDGKLEFDDVLNNKDVFSYMSTSNQGSTVKSLGSSISFTDLISSLYSQAEKTPIDKSEKAVLDGSVSTQIVLDSNIVNVDDDFDDPSWEFKASFSETTAGDQTSVISPGDTLQQNTTKLKVESNMEFFSKLKDELCLVVLDHVDNLKKAKSVAALSKEDAKVADLDENIKEAYKVLEEENAVSMEVHMDNYPSRISCNEFCEVLLQSKFQILESAYDMSRRLSLAEKDLRSAIELLKDASSISKVLSFGSTTEQSNYISTWSRIMSVCAEELKHGVSIWKQSIQHNVDGEILSELRGQQYILGIGEIYRVVQVLGASAKFYEPWILTNCVDPTSFLNLLEECSALWSNSGLEEALRNISVLTDSGYDGFNQALLESIKHIRDLDCIAFENPLLAQEDPICQLSLLTPEIVPGMKMVVWNGENYFLCLANLWANMIHCDPPKLLHIHVG